MKPLLSATVENIEKLKFPLIASPKLDGIRALVINGELVSRKLKPIPNLSVRALFGHQTLDGFDGELICGDPTDPAVFRKTTSAVMSHEGVPGDVVFHIFDNFLASGGFLERFETLWGSNRIAVVPHAEIKNLEELQEREEIWLNQGYEGVMLRDPQGPYKYGRSTLREGILMKLKRFSDDEAVIVGFEEQLQNTNELTRDALGKAKRSNHQSGMVGKGTLGSLEVLGMTGPFKGVRFSVGSGMDDLIRSEFWNNQSKYKGKVIKFKYFMVGSKDAPRFPTFLGFREDL